MTVSELLSKLSSAELTEWVAFYRIKLSEQKNAEQKRNLSRKARSRGSKGRL